jgi:Domain of unknown function (DUF222)
VFDQLRRAVGDLEAVSRGLDPGCLDGRAASALVEVAARGERICSAIKALGARRVEETNAWREGGHRSAAHWVAETTGEMVGAARRALETARALEHLPQTDAAFRAGHLSPTQASEITSAAGADPAAESALLETAAGTSVKGLRDRCREVRAGAEADDAAWARRLHVERRAHEWTDPDGAYRLEARLAPDAGARFSAAWRGTSSGSSRTPGAPDAATPVPPTPPTRSSRLPAKGRASPSRSGRWSTAPRSSAGTSIGANGARSPASAPCR